jgi:hypothetical protein
MFFPFWYVWTKKNLATLVKTRREVIYFHKTNNLRPTLLPNFKTLAVRQEADAMKKSTSV